jgi:hypothetical protein
MRSHEGEAPQQFATGFRGYRRAPVDEYVSRLHGWLMDSEARAEDAVKAATATVGERVTHILRAALEAGEDARKDAEAEAGKKLTEADDAAAARLADAEDRAAKRLADAERRAADVIRSAEDSATQTRKRAEAAHREAKEARAQAVQAAKADAERTMEQSRKEITALRQAIDELTARRANALAELGRLQQYLAGTPDAGTAGPLNADAPAALAAPAQAAPMEAAPDELTPLSAAPDSPAAKAKDNGKDNGEDTKEAVFTNANGDRPS